MKKMRKYLVMLMVVVLSAAMFAGEMRGPKWERNCGPRGEKGGFEIFKIAAKEDFIKAGVTEDNYNKAKAAAATVKAQIDKNNIAEKQKELEVQKLMLEENKNWTEIEKNLTEAAKLDVDSKLKQMKARDEIKKYITDDQMQALRKIIMEKRQMQPGKGMGMQGGRLVS